ncbi:MAG: Maf family protein [Pseudomonadales bacterium]|nr:Maf family protein [Pseudomonadales bacterium]
MIDPLAPEAAHAVPTETRHKRLILASSSPRRRELLRQIGVQFDVAAQNINETPGADETPTDYVCRLALAKARAVMTDGTVLTCPILGADTIVVCAGQLLGKPMDRAHALSMLARLSGTTHEVLSAVAMIEGRREAVLLSATRVSFRDLSPLECERYWQSGEPEGKAGAYAIQGLAAMFVSSIEGSYSGVVGLPLFETCELLQQFGVSTGLS